MERKEIMTLAAVILGVILLIAAIKTVSGSRENPDLLPDTTVPSAPYAVTTTTDYWEYLRGQTETSAVTELTDEEGNAVTTDATEGTGQPAADETDAGTDAPVQTDGTALPDVTGETETEGYEPVIESGEDIETTRTTTTTATTPFVIRVT